MASDHTCTVCQETFDSEKALHIHESKKHPSKQAQDLQELIQKFDEEASKVEDLKAKKDNLEKKLEEKTGMKT